MVGRYGTQGARSKPAGGAPTLAAENRLLNAASSPAALRRTTIARRNNRTAKGTGSSSHARTSPLLISAPWTRALRRSSGAVFSVLMMYGRRGRSSGPAPSSHAEGLRDGGDDQRLELAVHALEEQGHDVRAPRCPTRTKTKI